MKIVKQAVLSIWFWTIFVLCVQPSKMYASQPTVYQVLEQQLEDWKHQPNMLKLVGIADTTPMETFNALLNDRIIFLGVPINAYAATVIQNSLLELEQKDSTKPITLFINSPGGSAIDGLGIYDVMQNSPCEISTIATSMAASMGALLLAAGTKGKRFALSNCLIMIHHASMDNEATITDKDIYDKLFEKMNETLYQILSKHTGQPIEKIRKDCLKDYWMTAQEAKEYGIIDGIIERKK